MGNSTPVRAFSLAALGILILAMAGLALGTHHLELAELRAALSDPTSEAAIIIGNLRLPRTVLAIVVGCALGVAGTLMQGHTNNPIADPVLLGISAGAGLGVATAIFLLRIETLAGYVWFGLLGAAIASAVVALISKKIGVGLSSLTLVLGGVAVQAGFISLTSGILLQDEKSLDTYRFWTVGSVASRNWDVIVPLLPIIFIGLSLAAINAPALNVLALGDDVASSLGTKLNRVRLVGISSITLLTGAAVAATGPIGFVGLMCAHIGRSQSRADWRWAVPLAGVYGANFLLAADIVGRLVLRPGEVPVGITLAVVGAPYFIYCIRRGGIRA